MHQRLNYLLSWSAPNLSKAVLSPPNLPANLGELINHYRLQLPYLRPHDFEQLNRADQARIDGLLVGMLLLDGLLSLPETLKQGQALRLAADDMARYQFTHQHIENHTVDFALRMMIEQTGKRSRDLLQGSAALGRSWIGGARYRLSIARAEQLLRLAQTQPETVYTGMDALGLKSRLMMQLRIAWRVLSKQA